MNDLNLPDDPSISVHRMLYTLRERAVSSKRTVRFISSRILDIQNSAPMYFSRVKLDGDSLILSSPKFIANAIDWGEHPDIFFVNSKSIKRLKKFLITGAASETCSPF
jgi:hypothetical protein